MSAHDAAENRRSEGTAHGLCSEVSGQLPAPAGISADVVRRVVDDRDAVHRRRQMERAELELTLLTEISRVLGSTLDLQKVFDQTMRVLAERLGMERGSMVLLDESSGKLRTETAWG